MTKKANRSSEQDSALDMMKRVFAVAELIVQSDTYQTNKSQIQKKPQKTQK